MREIVLRFRPRRVGRQNQPADKREQENGMTSEERAYSVVRRGEELEVSKWI
jgi:hypothetical protein